MFAAIQTNIDAQCMFQFLSNFISNIVIVDYAINERRHRKFGTGDGEGTVYNFQIYSRVKH